MPDAKTIMDLRSAARGYTGMCINVLAGVARSKKAAPAARVQAVVHLLDRGWGKADQNHTVDTNIQVTIRHILEHIDERPVIIQGEEVRCIDADTTVVKDDDSNPGSK